MGRLKNEFSWSRSRMKNFEECRRKYWFGAYGMWDGWDSRADARKKETYILSLFSNSAGAGEGTGIPAAAGTLLMAQGSIESCGVYPPEAAVKPLELLMLALTMVKRLGKGGEESFHLERIDADGVVTKLPLPI